MINQPKQNTNNNLPNALREAMLQADAEKALLVLEALYRLGFKPGEWFLIKTIQDLLSEKFGMNPGLVYLGLQKHMIFQRRKVQAKAYEVGARPFEYRIPHPDELMVEYAVSFNNTLTDKLQDEDFRTVKAYRKGLHREMFRRKFLQNNGEGFSMSRKYMAERLGVSPRTIRTYDKELGFSNEANYKEEEVSWGDLPSLPRYKDKYDKTGKRQPSRYWLKTFNEGTPVNLPFVRHLACKALNEGHLVYKVERLTNTYYPYQHVAQSRLADYGYDPSRLMMEDWRARNAAGFYRDTQGQWYDQRE